jgi:hypothetical protein
LKSPELLLWKNEINKKDKPKTYPHETLTFNLPGFNFSHPIRERTGYFALEGFVLLLPEKNGCEISAAPDRKY